jgi:hypothetical protein
MKSGPITGAKTRPQVAIIVRQSVDVNQRCWQHRSRLHQRLGRSETRASIDLSTNRTAPHSAKTLASPTSHAR